MPELKDNIIKISYFDGLKITFENNYWLCIRFSGNENVIRVFIEQDSEKHCDEILSELQKQYNYLESHPDYGLCHTNYNVINESGVFIKIPKVTIYGDNEYLYRMIADGNCIATLTVVLRKSLYDICPKYYIGMNWAMEDKPTWLEIAALSKIGYIDEVTSSYRIVKGSASHGRDMRKVMQFATSGFELDNFYDKKYNLGVNRPKNEFYEYCLKEALRIGDKKVARELFTQSINDRSMNLRILFLFLCAILSFTRVFSIIRALKR